MTRVPKVAAGTYDGEPFILLDRVLHIEGGECLKRVEAYVIELFDGSKKYVLDYDPLLKFDPISTNKKPWYEWEWSEIIEESNFITFPYEDYWVCRHKHAHDAVAVGATRQGALDNCILVLCLYSGVERADNQEGAE